MNNKTKTIVTFSLIGIAAYITTDIIHEVLGHSLVVLIIGHKITLLSSVYFRANPGSIITDLAGPISNLLFGLLLFVFLKRKNNLSALTRLFLILVMSFNFYWFSGTVIQSSFSKYGDWVYLTEELGLGSSTKIFLIILGVSAYYFSIKISKVQIKDFNHHFSGFPLRQFNYVSYTGAAISAIIAGLFFMPDRFSAAGEGLLEMIASIPIIFIALKDKTQIKDYLIPSKTTAFNLIVILVFILFCFTLGQGFILS